MLPKQYCIIILEVSNCFLRQVLKVLLCNWHLKFTAIYSMLILGIGLFISNHTDTQQQTMFIARFFTVIFILMSGLFTPIESMPTWVQKVILLNPIRYFVEVIRMVLSKGTGFSDIKTQLAIIVIYSSTINGFAVWSFKKTN